MDPDDVGNALLVIGVVVLMLRILVGVAYPRRTSKVWTFAIPTIALLIYFVRAAIMRVIELPLNDWAWVWTLALLVGSQALATAYQWWPASTPNRR